MASVVAHGGVPPLDHLPSALLQQIMGFLDLPSLLTASAVSARLHECALSSMRSIKLYRPTTAACSFLSAYLAKHGQHVSSLQLLCSRYVESAPSSSFGRSILAGNLQELPAAPSLQHLELQHLTVERAVLQAVAACTRLTQLCISRCRVTCWPSNSDITASDFGGLRHLQHLQLTGFRVHPDFGAVLSVLVKLTHLTWGWHTCDQVCWHMSLYPVLQHITCATNLRELRLPDAIEGPSASSSLPSLTSLQQLCFLQFNARAAVQPGLPSSLQRLVVRHFNPASLAGVAQLKHLELSVADNPKDIYGVAESVSEARLVKLAEQTHLTFLKLTAPIIASPAAYAALTASSQLQHLDLVSSDSGRNWKDAVPHLFSSVNCSLPQLRHLAFRRPEYWWRTSRAAHVQYSIGMPKLGNVLLARAVSCCPSLQHLDIMGAVSRRVHLSSLLHAPHLTALLVSTITDRDAAQVVAQLSNLQRLEVGRIGRDGRITAAGLQHLTALQHLTFLRLKGDGWSSDWGDRYEYSSSGSELSVEEPAEEWSDDGASPNGTDDSEGLPTAMQRMDVSPGLSSHSPRPHSGCAGDEQGFGPCSAANSSEARPCYNAGEELSAELLGHGCSKLQASECRLSDACLATIAQITSLKELHLINHVDLTNAGMLELTAPKQLTWLEGPESLLAHNSHSSSTDRVQAPSDVWERGLTHGAPVWPELLGRLVHVKDRALRQRAKQAVLDNREALLGVLGPELAREVAELRLVREEYDEDGGDDSVYCEESELELRHEADGRVVFLGCCETPPYDDMEAAPLRTAATAMRDCLWRVVTTLAPPPVDMSSFSHE